MMPGERKTPKRIGSGPSDARVCYWPERLALDVSRRSSPEEPCNFAPGADFSLAHGLHRFTWRAVPSSPSDGRSDLFEAKNEKGGISAAGECEESTAAFFCHASTLYLSWNLHCLWPSAVFVDRRCGRAHSGGKGASALAQSSGHFALALGSDWRDRRLNFPSYLGSA